jgi:hypothetical protein
MRTAIDSGARLEGLITAIGHSTVGFMRFRGDASIHPLGSGTLIKHGGVFGVLTCGHVWKAVSQEAEIGIMCFTVRGRSGPALRLGVKLLNPICFGDAPWHWTGPDIAFVRLPASTESHFRSVATVRDLQRQIDLLTSGAFNRPGEHAVAGIVDEWTTPGAVRANRKSISYTALVSLGSIRRRFMFAVDHDEWIYKPEPPPETDLPGSYGGTSGGGLWRFNVDRVDDTEKLHALLVGVAHYETPKRNIVCAGPASVYRKILDEMRARWPSDCP